MICNISPISCNFHHSERVFCTPVIKPVAEEIIEVIEECSEEKIIFAYRGSVLQTEVIDDRNTKIQLELVSFCGYGPKFIDILV